MKKLLLHIGTAKTGTTSIQAGLAANADRLAAAGFFYPCRSGAAYLQNDQHAPLVSGLYGHDIPWLVPQKRQTVNQALPEVLADIAASTAGTVILSSEAFGSPADATEETLHRLRTRFSDFDVHVVVYIRRQDHLLLSHYQQNVKAGGLKPFDFERLQALEILQYRRRLDPWRMVFGADRLTVRPFDKRFWTSDDPFLDFIETIGAPQIDVVAPVVENESLDYRMVELMRQVNVILKTRMTQSADHKTRVRTVLKGIFRNQHTLLPQKLKMQLSSEQSNQMRAAFREQNAWCLEGTGIDVDAFFPETPPGTKARNAPTLPDDPFVLSVLAVLASAQAGVPFKLNEYPASDLQQDGPGSRV